MSSHAYVDLEAGTSSSFTKAASFADGIVRAGFMRKVFGKCVCVFALAVCAVCSLARSRGKISWRSSLESLPSMEERKDEAAFCVCLCAILMPVCALQVVRLRVREQEKPMLKNSKAKKAGPGGIYSYVTAEQPRSR